MPLQLTPRLSTKRPRFPNRIREYRLKSGLTQTALGRLVGKGRKIVSAWERGVRLPTVANALKLARALATLVEGLWESLYSPRKVEQGSKEGKR